MTEPTALVVQASSQLAEDWCALLQNVGLAVRRAVSARQAQLIVEAGSSRWRYLLVDEELLAEHSWEVAGRLTRGVGDNCIRAVVVAKLTPARIVSSHALGLLALPSHFLAEAIQRFANLGQSAQAAPDSRNAIVVDPAHETVHSNGRLLALTKHQRLIMKRLALTPNKVVSPEELCQFAGIQRSSSHQNLHNELWRLRSRLGSEMATSIVNVRGQGYRFSP